MILSRGLYEAISPIALEAVTRELLASVGVIGNFARARSSLLINTGAIGNVSYTAPTNYVGEG